MCTLKDCLFHRCAYLVNIWECFHCRRRHVIAMKIGGRAYILAEVACSLLWYFHCVGVCHNYEEGV